MTRARKPAVPDSANESSELAFILACAGARPGPVACERIRRLGAAPIDWQTCASLASSMGLAPLLAINLQNAGVTAPGEMHAQLASELCAATADGLAAARQASVLLECFAAAGIQALAYKGPALSIAAYGHAGARVMRDLDLVVPRRAMVKARDVLAAAGYRLDLKAHRVFAALPAAAQEDVFHPTAPGLLTVELHAAVTPWRLAARFDFDALASRAVTVMAAGVPLKTLAPEDHLLVGAAHATVHSWTFRRHVSDLDGLIAGGVDWPMVLERARGARVERMLAVGLVLAADCLGTVLPEEVTAWTRRDREAAALAAFVRSRWFDPSAEELPRWAAARMAARYRERLADKGRYVAREQIISLLEKLPWERWRPPPRHLSSPSARP